MDERGGETCGGPIDYPPEGCLYEVHYTLGPHGAGSVRFPDEFALGRWFTAMAAEGMFAPEDFTVPDEDGRNGYRILCVTDDGRTEISYFHPRLVRGRIESRRRRR